MPFLQGLFGPPDVMNMESKCDFKGLIKALAYESDRKICFEAAAALGRLKDPRAIDPLINALSDLDMEHHASESLVELGTPAVEPLIRALKHNVPAVAYGAAKTLGKLGNRRAVESLIVALKDNDKTLRWCAVMALGRIGDTRAVEPLLAALQDKEGLIRSEAADALGKIGDARAAEPLVTMMYDSHSSPGEEVSAKNALAKIGVSAIHALMMRPGTLSFGLLTQIGSPVVESLLALLQHEDPWVRKNAAEALGKMRDARAVEPLIVALRDKESYVRTAAVMALGLLKDLRATEPLVAMLQDEKEEVRFRTTIALDSLRWKPSEDENGVRYWIAGGHFLTCVKVGEPAVDPLVTVALKDDNPTRREGARRALEKIRWIPDKDEQGACYWIARGIVSNSADSGVLAVKPLMTALEHPDRKVRKEVAKALVELYRSNELEREQKELILSARLRFPQTEHADIKPHHEDTGDKGRSCHDDHERSHEDYTDLGVDFPL